MQKIIDRIEPFLFKNEDTHPSHGIAGLASEIGTTKDLVIYRIKLGKKTGKFEHRDLSSVSGQEA